MKKILILTVLLIAICEPANNGQPELVSQQDNVKLYRVQRCAMCDIVYFTTPCGDVSYNTLQFVGKVAIEKRHQVAGTGCK